MTMISRHRLTVHATAHGIARGTAFAAALVAVSATLALAGASADAAGARPGAHATCAPGGSHVPHLTAPCDGATVPRRHPVTFMVVDPDRLSAAQGPYLNLQTTRTIVDGHLALNRNANGIFAQMTPVRGRPHAWTYTAPRQLYASWWDNRRGTAYVQVEQVDPSVASGVLYGPITTVRVR